MPPTPTPAAPVALTPARLAELRHRLEAPDTTLTPAEARALLAGYEGAVALAEAAATLAPLVAFVPIQRTREWSDAALRFREALAAYRATRPTPEG